MSVPGKHRYCKPGKNPFQGLFVTGMTLIALLFFPWNPITGQSPFAAQEISIDSLMQAHLVFSGKHPVHNFLLYAKNEKTGFEVHKGAGTIGRNNTPIDANYQYNCASITKTFVATIVLQLEEEGKLKTTDKAFVYLNQINYLKFSRFHILNDTAYTDNITIGMLLNHTSGIADIFTDAATKFNISVLLHKKRQYDQEKIVKRYFKYNLNKKPKNKPGEGYHYSDMNYVLLGLIIEQITNKTLPQNIRERILEPLHMTDTYFEYYEPARGKGKRIDAYLNKINMTKKINTSYEWAGGGLVTTTKDLGVFIEALFGQKLFENPQTLVKMTDVSTTEPFGATYGMGIFTYTFKNKIFYGHGGFYGSVLAYDPLNKITFSANIGQAIPPYDGGKLIDALLDVVLRN